MTTTSLTTTYFFTDGACPKNNAKVCERCGAGLYIMSLPIDDRTVPNKKVNVSFYQTIRKGETYKTRVGNVVKEIVFDHCTNNVGELCAIEMALKHAFRLNIFNPTIVTDSMYVFGIFNQNHKAKQNVELINLIKLRIETYNFKIKWIHVNSHQKITDTMTEEEKMLHRGNEMADKAAVMGAKLP